MRGRFAGSTARANRSGRAGRPPGTGTRSISPTTAAPSTPSVPGGVARRPSGERSPNCSPWSAPTFLILMAGVRAGSAIAGVPRERGRDCSPRSGRASTAKLFWPSSRPPWCRGADAGVRGPGVHDGAAARGRRGGRACGPPASPSAWSRTTAWAMRPPPRSATTCWCGSRASSDQGRHIFDGPRLVAPANATCSPPGCCPRGPRPTSTAPSCSTGVRPTSARSAPARCPTCSPPRRCGWPASTRC